MGRERGKKVEEEQEEKKEEKERKEVIASKSQVSDLIDVTHHIPFDV